MSDPAISVVMSVYNAERYLREAIDSIISQTFADFEFVIVDDGSKDGSLAILRAYEANDKRFKIISRPNKGLTVSLNEALGVCHGEFIARMDADDIAAPERFAKQIAFLRNHPDVVVVGGSVELIDPYGVHIGIVNYPADHAEIDQRLLTGEGGVLPHPATMLRTAAVRQIGNYREQYNNSEDLDLWLRLAEVGQVANLPEVVLKYRRDLGSVSHTKRDNQIRMKGQILGEAFDRRGLAKPDKWVFDTWMPKPKDEQLKEWGWRALRLGRKDAARGHAMALLKLKPRAISSWKLAFCALRGR